jgi:hypothetical protein
MLLIKTIEGLKSLFTRVRMGQQLCSLQVRARGQVQRACTTSSYHALTTVQVPREVETLTAAAVRNAKARERDYKPKVSIRALRASTCAMWDRARSGREK